jgi:hypothetical protein
MLLFERDYVQVLQHGFASKSKLTDLRAAIRGQLDLRERGEFRTLHRAHSAFVLLQSKLAFRKPNEQARDQVLRSWVGF